jgi:uncharacterized membrane protein YsdA (DUF1294 family)
MAILGLSTAVIVLAAAAAALQVVPFAAYGLDKLMAGGGGRRVPEATLLVLTLLFGAAGSVLAMFLFRHKVRKASFLLKFAGILVLRGAALGLLVFVIWKLVP